MPLPAALAARLSQRGLLQSKIDSKKEKKKSIHEEVIAEDYDNPREKLSTIDLTHKFMGYPPCPNKYNIHHGCTKKCKELWGKGYVQPSENYLKRQIKLLKKYPLPEKWKAVYDAGSGIHYYWDWSSDLVSWLPPSHPKSKISQPVSLFREESYLKETEPDDNLSSDESKTDQEIEEIKKLGPKRDKKDIKEKGIQDNRNKNKDYRDIKGRNRDRDRYRGADFRLRHSKSVNKDRVLDPMDPAAYSNIPRGKWSDGLPLINEAKTGVDTTASGPLYQMRPYPSPGAVLRSNKGNTDEEEGQKKKESSPEFSSGDSTRKTRS